MAFDVVVVVVVLVAELLVDDVDEVVLVALLVDDGGKAFPSPGTHAAVNAAAPSNVASASLDLRDEPSADVTGRADMRSFRLGNISPPVATVEQRLSPGGGHDMHTQQKITMQSREY